MTYNKKCLTSGLNNVLQINNQNNYNAQSNCSGKRQTKKERAFIYILKNPNGVTENEILRGCHLSSGRNYPNELERLLGINLERNKLLNPDGIGWHTQYVIRCRADAEKIVNHINIMRVRRGIEPMSIFNVQSLLMAY